MRTICLILGLVAGVLHAEPAASVSLQPQPRVAGMYSSWPKGAASEKTNHVGLFASLGWPFLNLENTNVGALVADLDRFDIFCPSPLYNYEHPQSFSTNLPQWKQFLERGGVIIGLDANYGQQVSWLTRLGEGLALGPGRCEIGCEQGTQKRITLTVTNEPFRPRTATTLPWGHFNSHGPGWQVLARCPDGHAVCLKATVGLGVVIATTLYRECGYPDATCLERIWRAQIPRLMNAQARVTMEPAFQWVGRNEFRVTASGMEATALRASVWHSDGGRQLKDLPWKPDGPALLPVTITPGRTDLRLVLTTNGQPAWWTSLACENADLPADVEAVRARLRGSAADLDKLGPAHILRRQQQTGLEAVARVEAEARALTSAAASAANQSNWNALSVRLAALDEQAVVLSGRAAVGARQAAEGAPGTPPSFRVVRSEPLQKLHRDEPPPGALRGPLVLSAARGEGESARFSIVPSGTDLEEVRVWPEPLRCKDGGVIGTNQMELFRVGYVRVPGPSAGAPASPGWWPDPLLPCAAPFAIHRMGQPMWLDVFVPADARPGIYRGQIMVEAAKHRERVPVELEVFDFTLPREHSLRQFFVLRAYLVAQKYFGGTGDDYVKTLPVARLLKMADVCLKRRVGVQIFGNEGAGHPCSALPYLRETLTPSGWQFDFTGSDRVFEHLRRAGLRTLFAGYPAWGAGLFSNKPAERTAYLEFLEAYLRALEPHLEQNGWLAEAVFYMVDEPWSPEAVQANLDIAAVMDRAAPRLKRLMTAPRNQKLWGRSQIWVPVALPEAHPEDTNLVAQCQFWRARQAEPWWYICCAPTHPYPNFFVDYPTLDSRMVFWLTWKYAKTGFLYWGVEYYGDPKHMTPDGPDEHYALGPANMGNGDGVLCYYGPDLAFYPSIRLNAIRDGVEDYEYFALLRKLADAAEKVGKAPAGVAAARKLLAVDERVLKLTNSSPNFTYTLDAQPLLLARRELAARIVELQRASDR